MSVRFFFIVGFALLSVPFGSTIALSQEAGGDAEMAGEAMMTDEGHTASEKADAQALLKRARELRRSKIYDDALVHYQKALKLQTALGDTAGEAIALRGIGRTYRDSNQPQKALESYKASLARIRALGHPAAEATVLADMGFLYPRLGEYSQAIDVLTKALNIRRSLDESKGVARVLVNLGAVYLKQSRYSRAIESLNEAKAILQQLEPADPKTLARALNNLGLASSELGRYAEARKFYEQALPMLRNANDSAGVANVLHNIGFSYSEEKNYLQAVKYYRRALASRKEVADNKGRASTLNNIGFLLYKQGKTRRALRSLEQALELSQELGHRLLEARALDSLGEVYAGTNKHAKAQSVYYKALVIKKALGDRRGERITLANLGRLFEAQNLNPVAILFYKMSVNVSEAIRQDLSALPTEQRDSYIRKVSDIYRSLTDLLIREGRLLEAQQVLAMLKEEEYFDYIRRRDDGVRHTQTNFTKQEESWRASVVALGLEHAELVEKQHLTAAEEARRTALEESLDRAIRAFDEFLAELKVAFKETERAQEREFPQDELNNLIGFQGTLEQLGPGTVAIHFFSTTDKLRIIVTGGNTSVPPFDRHSPIGEEALNRLIFDYRETLQNPRKDPLPQAQQLYGYLIKPIEADLRQMGAKTLLVYLDGVLRYLPLTALHDDGDQPGVTKCHGYVAECYAVVIYTPAAKERLATSPSAVWRVAGLGVSEEFENFPALAAVEDELDGIVKEPDPDVVGILPGVRYVNAEFTKARLTQVLRDKYPVVHLASHFRFVPGIEEDSFLLLGSGEQLNLAELKSLKYPLTNVELLTLSACETGLGGAGEADGREVEGLGVLAQRRGAKAVLATLWSVADRSTGQFMQLFYELREREKHTKAAAMQRVQRMFIRGETKVPASPNEPPRGVQLVEEGEGAFAFDPQAPYAHPYYWAPFILMGNFL